MEIGGGELMTADEVAAYLGVGAITVYRWCRNGRLPGLKIGKVWRVRRVALEEFMRRSEHGHTLASRLTAFLEVPDHVLAIAADSDLLHRLDSAFFRVAESRGGVLIKGYADETEAIEDLRAELTGRGLDVAALEAAGRFHFEPRLEVGVDRADVLRRLLATPGAAGRPIWVSFDWVKGTDVETALRQQHSIADLVDTTALVVKTAVLEQVVNTWSAQDQRRAQQAHSGMISMARRHLTCSRVIPLPDA